METGTEGGLGGGGGTMAHWELLRRRGGARNPVG